MPASAMTTEWRGPGCRRCRGRRISLRWRLKRSPGPGPAAPGSWRARAGSGARRRRGAAA
jgi:hypothetical protein